MSEVARAPGEPAPAAGATALRPLDLVPRLISFCRALRERGLLVTTGHALDALHALEAVGLADPLLVHQALRCVLAARPEEFAIFDELFTALFSLPPDDGRQAVPVRGGTLLRKPPKAPPPPSLASWLNNGAEDPEESGEAPEEVPGASGEPSRAQKDFSTFSSDDLAELEKLAARLARRLALRPSRRWKSARRGPRIDLRRSIRRSLQTGAEAVELLRRARKPRKTRIVALCDVSGSMDLYRRFLLQFLYALQGSVARVESFVFSTGLRRVTEALRERPFGRALRELSTEADGWSGGTRIGASLAAFNQGHERLLDGRTVVVILSDGWDTGEPALLSDELESIRRRCRRLIWLNPLLGSPGYEPLTQGMQAALPHVNVFASAHNLASLRALERHLLA